MSTFRPFEKPLWLHRVYEWNYQKLTDLIPNLSAFNRSAVAQVQGKPPLRVRVLERSPYTLILELTHDFRPPDLGRRSEPAVRIRVALDARVAEALSDHHRPCVGDALGNSADAGAVLEYKWQLNYFLTRWLDHCLSNNYRFGRVVAEPAECLAD